MQPTIVLLKDGTDKSQGIPQCISNINAVGAVVDILKTTLGPRGMDKCITVGNSATVSNDGATLIRLLDIVHPAAKCLTDIAKSQDDEIGDGTTSVVLLAGEILKLAKPFLEDKMHPQNIIRGLRLANNFAIEKIQELSISLDSHKDFSKRELLERCASTALNSKLIANQKEFFAPLVVDAVLTLDPEMLDINMIGIKKVPGGSVTDSFLVSGVAFKKTFAYAGFEQQPKSFSSPKIVVLNVELELKSEKENAEIRISKPSEYQSIVDAEWSIIYNKLDKIVKSGATIVLSKLPIGDLATQYFADRDIFCAGRVTSEDINRVCKATGAIMQTSLEDLSSNILGVCERFEERQIGNERYNLFLGCLQAKTATIVLRGGAQQFIEEAHRSLHDAIMIVRRACKYPQVVGGGGAIEMELSSLLREKSYTIKSHLQFIVSAFARALEVIPRQLTINAGFDANDIIAKLRTKHTKDQEQIKKYNITTNIWEGVDIDNEDTCDTMKKLIWEPSLVKINAIGAATEAACLILSVDETIKNPKSEGLPDQGAPNAPMQQRGPAGGFVGGAGSMIR